MSEPCDLSAAESTRFQLFGAGINRFQEISSIAFVGRYQLHLGMRDLRLTVEKSYPAVNEILLPCQQIFLYPARTLKPHEVDRAGAILKCAHQALRSFVANGTEG